MAAPKTTTKWGVLGAVQAVAGTGTALVAATHGLRTIEALGVNVQYAYDGKRPGKAPGTPARLGLVGPEGRFADWTMKQEGGGGGAAYSASVVPVPHLMLRMAGFDAALDATGGAESYTYTPADEANYTYATLESYERGQKYALLDAMGDTLEVGGELGQIPVWTLNGKSLVSALPTDSAIPAITYNATPGAKATQMALAIGDFLPTRVHDWKFTVKRNLQARAYDQANGRHGGFWPDVERQIMLELFFETPTMPGSAPFHTASALNARALLEAAEELGISFTVGGTQYRKFSIAAVQAVGEIVAEDKKGAIAMTRATFGFFPSGETTNDEVTVTFD